MTKKSKIPERREFMSDTDKIAMGNKPRNHGICKKLTGVMRPGKTAKDKFKRTTIMAEGENES